uniref:Uncharacterized protein n=1 Tax=Cacopsylla melanoneura TaxID=428564 RepID=A0A8D9FEY6_9HEMI
MKQQGLTFSKKNIHVYPHTYAIIIFKKIPREVFFYLDVFSFFYVEKKNLLGSFYFYFSFFYSFSYPSYTFLMDLLLLLSSFMFRSFFLLCLFHIIKDCNITSPQLPVLCFSNN